MLFEELKSKGVIQPVSCASMVEDNDPCLLTINYFLSLDGITGFGVKKKEFLQPRKNLPKKNSREVDFAALLAEFEAMRLIGTDLGLIIVGLEQPPPGLKKNCDIVAKLNGIKTFFEVKNRSSVHTQKPPEALQKVVRKASLPFDGRPEWSGGQKSFTSADATLLKAEIRQHIEHFQQKNNRRRKSPEPLYWPEIAKVDRDQKQVVVYFKRRKPTSNPGGYLASVDLMDDYCSYILGTGKTGNDGKEMVPMAHAAEKKDANYLMCRVGDWPSLENIVEGCFNPIQKSHHSIYCSGDPRLGALSGIILFTAHDRFLVVNNSNAKKKNWIIV